jgi:sec-independent protein translocase protein TatC
MPEPKLNREDYIQGQSTGSWLHDLEGHLGELRYRILISAAALGLACLVTFNYSEALIRFLQALAPSGSSFIQLKPGEVFLCSLKISVTSAIIIALPVILWQIRGFIKPGLSETEARAILPLFWLSPFFFYLGIVFAYYLVLPPLLAFLFGFNSGIVESRYGLEHYLDLASSMLIICGVVFQLPVIMLILGLLNLVTSRALLALWRHVILIAFIAAAVLTPTPDPLTMSIVAGALLGLYFTTAGLLRLIGK